MRRGMSVGLLGTCGVIPAPLFCVHLVERVCLMPSEELSESTCSRLSFCKEGVAMRFESSNSRCHYYRQTHQQTPHVLPSAAQFV